MSFRDFTLQNAMIWGAGAVLALGGAALGAAAMLPRSPAPSNAQAAAPAVAVAAQVVPSAPAPLPVLAPPPAVRAERVAAAVPRPHPPLRAVHLPMPPRPAPSVTRARLPALPPVAPEPGYAEARWQRTYAAVPPPTAYYPYQPRYPIYRAYPGY